MRRRSGSCRRSRTEHDGELGEPPQHQPVAVTPAQRGGSTASRIAGNRRVQRAERDRAPPAGPAARRGSGGCRGRGRGGRRRCGGCRTTPRRGSAPGPGSPPPATRSPGRTRGSRPRRSGPPRWRSGTSSAAPARPSAWHSSTARGTRSGSATRASRCAGWRSSATVALPIRLVVVSCPATTSWKIVESISCLVSAPSRSAATTRSVTRSSPGSARLRSSSAVR